MNCAETHVQVKIELVIYLY